MRWEDLCACSYFLTDDQDEAKRIPVFKKWKCPEGVEGCMELGNPLSQSKHYPEVAY